MDEIAEEEAEFEEESEQQDQDEINSLYEETAVGIQQWDLSESKQNKFIREADGGLDWNAIKSQKEVLIGDLPFKIPMLSTARPKVGGVSSIEYEEETLNAARNRHVLKPTSMFNYSSDQLLFDRIFSRGLFFDFCQSTPFRLKILLNDPQDTH